MKRKKILLNPAISKLPQLPVAWYVAIRSYSDGAGAESLYALLVLEKKTSDLLAFEFINQPPKTAWILGILEDAMSYPQGVAQITPHRPTQIEFEQEQPWKALEPLLTQAEIISRYSPQTPLADRFFEQSADLFEAYQPQVPGILDGDRVSPELVAEFFSATAAYYRAAPWKKLDDTQLLALHFQPPDQECFMILMGQSGIQVGVLFFWSWQDLQEAFARANDPLAQIPQTGLEAINYEGQEIVLPADWEAAHHYGWEIAGPDAFPVPIIYTQDDISRPDGDLLTRYTVALRAATQFTTTHLMPDETGDYLPGSEQYAFETTTGQIRVQVQYPADEHQVLHRDASPTTANDPHIQAALMLAEQAWETQDPQERVSLARQAISVWEDCIQAYLVLGEESQTAEEACDHFQNGLLAAERTLDTTQIEAEAGRLWSNPAMRPYLQTRQGLIECLIEMEAYTQALPHCRELLRLNPPDHQGIRYALLKILMQLEMDAQVIQLLDQYPEEGFTGWAYTCALIAYRQDGDSSEARALLKLAIKSNAYVPDFLTGMRLIPDLLPDYTGFGDESEAMQYATDYFSAWWQTKGAIHWLKRIHQR